jgi:rhodanese-related sulfurtransferase
MTLVRFLEFESLAALIWSVALMGIGAAFGARVQAALDFMVIGGGAVGLGVLLAALAVPLGWRVLRRRRLLKELDVPRMPVEELEALVERGGHPLVIDVRSGAGRRAEPVQIPGATWMPLEDLRAPEGVTGDRDVVVYCNCPNEVTAARAARLLADQGLVDAKPLAGGLDAWVCAGHPTEGVPQIGQSPRKGTSAYCGEPGIGQPPPRER